MVSESMIDKLIDELEFLHRHIIMLKATKENQPIGIIRLSEILDMPKHKVRYSLRMLEQEGLIIPTTEGATVSDRYDEYMKEISDDLEDIVDMVNRLKSELDKA